MNNEEKILMLLEQMQGDIAELKQGQVKLEQGQVKLEQGQVKLEQGQVKLECKMNEGFENLTNLINEAAKDAARTEKLLREHIQQPIH